MDEWLTVSQAAKHVKTSDRTIGRYIAAGLLESARLPSGRLRIRRSAVDGLLRPAGGTE